jgi:hypothetical protein
MKMQTPPKASFGAVVERSKLLSGSGGLRVGLDKIFEEGLRMRLVAWATSFYKGRCGIFLPY